MTHNDGRVQEFAIVAPYSLHVLFDDATE